VDFVAVIDQVITLLRQRGRLTYSTLKRQFQLDEAALEDVKNELIEGQRVAVDERGKVLVWTGDASTGASAPSAPVAEPWPGPPRLHPALSRGEDPDIQKRPGRRTEADHGPVRLAVSLEKFWAVRHHSEDKA
jgi:hypothetical protein